MSEDGLVEQYVHMPHRITVDWSDGDDAWIARFPELRGCVGHGSHPTEAIERGYEMKRMWIVVALKDGDPIPQSRFFEAICFFEEIC